MTIAICVAGDFPGSRPQMWHAIGAALAMTLLPITSLTFGAIVLLSGFYKAFRSRVDVSLDALSILFVLAWLALTYYTHTLSNNAIEYVIIFVVLGYACMMIFVGTVALRANTESAE